MNMQKYPSTFAYSNVKPDQRDSLLFAMPSVYETKSSYSVHTCQLSGISKSEIAFKTSVYRIFS